MTKINNSCLWTDSIQHFLPLHGSPPFEVEPKSASTVIDSFPEHVETDALVMLSVQERILNSRLFALALIYVSVLLKILSKGPKPLSRYLFICIREDAA